MGSVACTDCLGWEVVPKFEFEEAESPESSWGCDSVDGDEWVVYRRTGGYGGPMEWDG
jgi:hypothetical protein